MDCSKTVTVKGGKVETTVPAHSAIALYAGATKASHPQPPPPPIRPIPT